MKCLVFVKKKNNLNLKNLKHQNFYKYVFETEFYTMKSNYMKNSLIFVILVHIHVLIRINKWLNKVVITYIIIKCLFLLNHVD